MTSRREQIRAYRFLRRRAVAALLSGDPDDRTAPLLRISRTTLAGLTVAVLLVAGFMLYGALRHGQPANPGHKPAAHSSQRASQGTP